MSQYARDLPPSQDFRSPLGTPPGVPGPLAAPAAEPPPDLGAPPPDQMPPGLQVLPPAPGAADEVPLLKAMIVAARDYSDIPTVDESERLQIEQVTTILQRLLAKNQALSNSATGASPQARKLLGAV